MRSDWDFYFCDVDGQPASIFVDLGIRHGVPASDRPYMAYVRLFMRAPRPDGLSSQEEFDELARLENQLTAALATEDFAIYVGRSTCGGRRDFYFYVRDPSNWTTRVSSALAAFAQYKYKAGSRPDEHWTAYLEYLYPPPEEMQRIQNRRVCESLQKNGDALSESRVIDHWAYFPDEDARARFLSTIEPLGFKVRELKRSDDGERPFGIRFFRIDPPSFASIDDVTLPLHRAAIEAGGDYDGWETQVIS